MLGWLARLLIGAFCAALALTDLSPWLAALAPQPMLAALLLVGVWTLGSLPLDWLGGYWLPQRHARSQDTLLTWLGRWGRAGLTQGTFYVLNLTMLSLMSGWLGWLGALGWLLISMLLLLGFQFYLHLGLTWATHRLENDQGRLLFVVAHHDRGFTGGIYGLPGKESIVYPQYWRERLREPVNQFLINRRHGAINTGAHGRGVLLALGWNLLLFAGALVLSGSLPDSSQGLLQTVSWYSLLSLLSGIGLLPWLSRRGSYEVDRWTYQQGLDPDLLREGLAQTERLRDAPSAGPATWAIWQSVPSQAQRERRFASQQPLQGAWQATRQAIFASWAGGNLLSRSLPEQIGRPELWVFLPGD
jgi:hypothetical protein